MQASLGGAGADVALGPVGWIAGVCVGEAIQSVLVNRPTDQAANRIRNAVCTKDAVIKEDLERELGKASTDFLERALARVHTHFLPRVHKRVMKLHNDPIVKGIRDPNQQALTCSDAVRLTRYVYKAWRQYIKAEAHLAYVEQAIKKINRHMRSTFPPTSAPGTPPTGGLVSTAI